MITRGWWALAAPAVLLLLAGAGQAWLSVRTDDPVLGATTLDVTGAEIGSVVVAAALLAGAATVAGLVGGRVVRLLAAVCLVLAGGLVLAQVIPVLGDPAGAAQAAVAQRTGRTGAQVSFAEAAAGGWVWLALVCAGLIVLAAVGCGLNARAVTSRQAPGPEAVVQPRTSADPATEGPSAGQGSQDDDTAWDELSRGVDPTDPR